MILNLSHLTASGAIPKSTRIPTNTGQWMIINLVLFSYPNKLGRGEEVPVGSPLVCTNFSQTCVAPKEIGTRGNTGRAKIYLLISSKYTNTG